MAKRARLTDAAGGVFSTATEAAPASEAPRKRVGRKPDPSRRGLKPTTLMLSPEHTAALHKAAAERVVAGKVLTLDKSEVLRLLLDAWIGKGAKAP